MGKSSNFRDHEIVVKKIDILKDIVNTIAGKDKIIKIIKNILDLIRISLINIGEKIKVSHGLVGNETLILKLKFLIQNPIQVLKYFLLNLNIRNEKRLAFISSNLSLFRYILRFGTLPFQLPYFVDLSKSLILDPSQYNWYKLLNNQQFLSKSIELYYTICDELDLLYKLKFYSNETFYNKIVYHESLSWQLDILLSLKNSFVKFRELKQKILETEVELRIKRQAIELSSGLQSEQKRAVKVTSRESELETKIMAFTKEIKLVKLDICKLIFDLLANSTDLFNIKTPKGTYNMISLMSGIVGFVKIWRTTKDKLLILKTKSKQP